MGGDFYGQCEKLPIENGLLSRIVVDCRLSNVISRKNLVCVIVEMIVERDAREPLIRLVGIVKTK